MRSRLVCLSTSSIPILCLKDPQIGDDNLSGTSSDGRGGSLEEVAGVLATPRQKQISVNNSEILIGLVWFYCISTIVGYLMPNPFLYISTVLFQTSQFSISTKFSFIGPINRILSGANTPGQSGPGNDGNNRVLHISKSFSITEAASPSDWSYLYAGMLSVYFWPQPIGSKQCCNNNIYIYICWK